jgi:SSS family solute:Na+ symporter
MLAIDYIILGAYLLFLLTLGPVFNRFNKSASDYFRAGGAMVWWIAGTAVVMGGFSAWSFTGGAARVYETGFFFLVLFACNFVAMWFTFFFLAARFRQMRVVTAVEAIRKRFGPVNEQVFTWIQVPQGLFFAGLGLYSLAVFTSGAFGLDMTMLIVVVGLIVTIMAVAGGAWAINAGQFVQALVFLSITAVMVYTTLAHPKVGGLSGLLSQLPSRHTNWTEIERPSVLLAFIATLLVNQVFQMNSLREGAGKYLIVKNGRDARKVTLLGIAAILILTPMWMIPAMGSVIVHSPAELAAAYPRLKNASEGAYVAMAQTTLPPGLLGLLVCAIFSASLDNLSSGVNVSAAVLVRNFYIRMIRPDASERRQVWTGRVLSIVGGLVMIAVALLLKRFSTMPLYSLVLFCAAAIGLPQAVPMFLGLFVRRAPNWSLWSTLLVGFGTSIALVPLLTRRFLNDLWAGVRPLSDGEFNDLKLAITTGVLLVACVGWFYLSTFIGRRTQSAAERARVEAFFAEMNTPIDMAREHGGEYESDERQYRVLGLLSVTFGGFIAVMAALPNSMGGRLGLLFCGGTVAAVGIVLLAVARMRAGATPTHGGTHLDGGGDVPALAAHA